MSDAGLMRLLALVRRQLGASDARVEIGGTPSDDERVVWCALGPRRRLVALFEQIPEDRNAAVARLGALAKAFHATADADAALGGDISDPASVGAALDHELLALAERAGARAALVIDRSSPMIWGRSDAQLGRDVDALLATSDTHGVCALMAHAIGVARAQSEGVAAGQLRHVEHGSGWASLTRSVAGSYLLVLAFDAAFSELRADRVAKSCLDRLERLIARLPPVDPPPQGARVLPMRHKLRSV